MRKSATANRTSRFYCRHHNRLVWECPREEGSDSCPLRRTCPAHDGTQVSDGGDRQVAGN